MIDVDFSRLNCEIDPAVAVDQVGQLVVRWDLEARAQLPGATNCIVLDCLRSDNSEVVLRLPLVGEERDSGFHAQIAFSGRGGVRVFESDASSRAALLERLRPGSMLHESGLDIIEQVGVACKLILEMVQVPPIHAIPLESWYEPFLAAERAEGIPSEIFTKAQRLASDLFRTSPSSKFLHGDLHHYNILQSGDGWVAIDPKGIQGDLAVEPAAFLRNPYTGFAHSSETMSLRICTFANQLGIPAQRTKDWAFAHNVLSAFWEQPKDRPSSLPVIHAIQQANI